MAISPYDVVRNHEAKADAHPQYVKSASLTALKAEIVAQLSRIAGTRGAKGDTGETGATGATGATGPQGPPGSGGTPPTGTGFRHITSDAEDATAKLVENADVHATAAIAESKLALNFATHANTNDPTAGQKAALAGSSGAPGAGNVYVTDADARNTNARTPTAHTHVQADVTGLTTASSPSFAGATIGPSPLTANGGIIIPDGSGITFGSAGDLLESGGVLQLSVPITFAGVVQGIKLDDLDAPDDNTDLDASTVKHGLMKKFPGGTTNFLREDGTFASPGASSTNIKQTEIDFGATPVAEASFLITDADVSAGSQLIGSVAYEAPTGKDLDELDMDGLDLKFAPGAGEFTVYARGMDGYIADKFKVNYLIG